MKMSDFPVVYGHCDAGCKRRVASYEEFLNSAAMAKIRPSGTGSYLLETGKCYKIVDSAAEEKWGFRINVVPLMINTITGYESAPITWVLDLPPFDIYDKFIKIRPLDFRFVETSITNEFNAEFVCEINDERQTLTYSTSILLANFDLSTLRYEVRVSGATECYQYNTDSTFKLSDTKSAYEYALDGGYTGTEEEFGIRLAEILNGNSNEPKIYTVTNNLTNVSTSNTATTAEEGSSYTATLTVIGSSMMNSATVTMGGVTQSGVWTQTGSTKGTINIPSVTGDIVITCNA